MGRAWETEGGGSRRSLGRKARGVGRAREAEGPEWAELREKSEGEWAEPGGLVSALEGAGPPFSESCGSQSGWRW